MTDEHAMCQKSFDHAMGLFHGERTRSARLEAVLRIIGNIVGGPTMTYAPGVEIQEWRRRAAKVSEYVQEGLRSENPDSGEQK